MPNQDPNQELFAAIAAEPAEPTGDVSVVRKKAKELRDAYLEKSELETRAKEIQSRITTIERQELPDLFNRVKISSLTVEKEGNHPSFVAERKEVYTAKIPEHLRQEALQWFEQTGHGDLVKAVIQIQFGMHEHERRLKVMKLLSDNEVQFTTAETVHHSTLRAFVEREIKKGSVLPHDLLGIYIFDEIKIV
jgi:hypothetical protein